MRNRILLCILLSIAGVLLFPTFCSAAHWNIQRILSLGDIYFIEFEELPIPVGCKVVDYCMDNYVAPYRIRSVKGLSSMGGENALKVINEAANEAYREDVKRVIKGR